MSEFMRSEFDIPSFPDVLHENDYYNMNTAPLISYQNQMPTIKEEVSPV